MAIVPKEVFDGITAVRDSGITNMFDYCGVIEVLSAIGYEEGAEWVKGHERDYLKGIFYGVKVDEWI